MSDSARPPEDPTDPLWWLPYAVLVAIVAIGLLGYLGKLAPGGVEPVDTTEAPTGSAAPPPSAR
jgi:hypothetical protein